MIADIFRATGIEGVRIQINSLGDSECRPAHREALIAHARERADGLCDNCQSRMEKNPLRVLDCKQKECQALMSDAQSTRRRILTERRDEKPGQCRV